MKNKYFSESCYIFFFRPWNVLSCFFLNMQESCISLRQERKGTKIALQRSPHTLPREGFLFRLHMHPGKQRNNHDHYTDPSCQPVRLAATRTLCPFAPARSHRSASSWARSNAQSSLGEAPLNTISFLVLQKVQAPRTTKVLKPPLALVLIESWACCHQTKRSELSTCGVNV